MAKILVGEDEYAALKKAAARARPASPSPSESVPKKMEAINKDVVARQENEEMREVSGEEKTGSTSHELDRTPWKEEEEEEEEDEQDPLRQLDELLAEYLSFVPKRRQKNAQKFVKGLILSPQVDVRHGVVYVKGKRVGHFFLILQHFFGGARAAPPKQKEFLARFLPAEKKKKKICRLSQASKTAEAKKKKEKKKKEKKKEKKRGVNKNIPSRSRLNEDAVSLLP